MRVKNEFRQLHHGASCAHLSRQRTACEVTSGGPNVGPDSYQSYTLAGTEGSPDVPQALVRKAFIAIGGTLAWSLSVTQGLVKLNHAEYCRCVRSEGLLYSDIHITRYYRFLLFWLRGGAAFSVSVGEAVMTNYLVYGFIRIAEYD